MARREFLRTLRMLRKRPTFALVSVATLALGIGACTLIFSVAYAILLRPLPYTDPERLVRAYSSNSGQNIEAAGLSHGDFLDARRQLATVSGLSAVTTRNANLTGGAEPETVPVAVVSPGLFQLLGISAAQGRPLLPSDEEPGQALAAVLSHDFWRRRFGGDPTAVGKVIRVDDEAYTIVGVMPASFAFPNATTELWLPLRAPSGGVDRMSRYLMVIGRLKPGFSLSQSNQEISTFARQLEGIYPESNRGWSANVQFLRESMVKRVRPALTLLLGAALLVLLIAITNVTNLFMVRAAERNSEVAVRTALGATRGSLLWMFLLESLMVGLIGGIVGVVLASWGVKAALASDPRLLPLASTIEVDRWVLLFSLFLVFAAGVLCGALPGVQMTRASSQLTLKEGSGGSSGRSGSRFRAALIFFESALAAVLLIGAGLMLKSSARLQRVDPGFNPDGAFAFSIILPEKHYPEDSDRIRFFTQLLEHLSTYPGIRSVAATSRIPLDSFGTNVQVFELERANATLQTAGMFAHFSAVAPGYFRTMGIPLLKGRDITERDADALPVVVVNQRLASLFSADRDPIGSRILLRIRGDKKTAYEIVGVVGDTRINDLQTDPEPAIYAPFRQIPHDSMVVVFRTASGAAIPAAALRRQIAEIDPNQPIFKSFTLTELIENAGARNRLFNFLFLFFGTAGLVLATLGIYGVIAYNSSLRTREIAIRMALGADVRDVLSALLLQPLKLAVLGTVLGLAAAFVLARFLATLLYGVSARDPLVFALVAVVLLGTAALAGLSASRRSLRPFDITTTLRPR
ncbi:MAG: ABC transporter permease [Thermoanaerobaculia bacterium]